MHMTDKEIDDQMAFLGESIVNMQLSFIEAELLEEGYDNVYSAEEILVERARPRPSARGKGISALTAVGGLAGMAIGAATGGGATNTAIGMAAGAAVGAAANAVKKGFSKGAQREIQERIDRGEKKIQQWQGDPKNKEKIRRMQGKISDWKQDLAQLKKNNEGKSGKFRRSHDQVERDKRGE